MKQAQSKLPNQQKYVQNKEFIFYLAAIFFYTMMTGIVGSYRQEYLVNIIRLSDDSLSFMNGFLSVAGFVLSFFYAMVIDNHKITKKGKFVPIINAVAIPMGIVTLLMFITPKGLTGTLLLIYLITIGLLHGACCSFGNAINLVSFVMSPDNRERDKVISFKSISSAVGNSAPLVVTLVIGLFVKDKQILYIISAALISVVGTFITLMGMRFVKERIEYTQEKKNPLEGFVDVIKNKYAWIIIVSETLKNFRQIANYMGVFLAAALLGGSDKFILFGLPTGIGTAVGMLVINMLLKKFNAKVLYIASGIYSITANVIAFTVGYSYFKTGSSAMQILFIACLFLIGLQFGASNLLPSMFQADVLEALEVQTKGKRLDAALPFVIGVGTMISGTVASSLSPKILYGDDSIIHYIQPTDENPDPVQSEYTKITMLFFYTVFHGIMMLLAGIPFLFYHLTGETKDAVHQRVLQQREELKK
ncbi:MAG: MFS transporter [Ruminococcaceae bacterium]|nr:MFS transporter [Oscillospiraceae bacterium]